MPPEMIHAQVIEKELTDADRELYVNGIGAVKTEAGLKKIWADLPARAKKDDIVFDKKEQMKAILTSEAKDIV